jgi:hypothetical protein
MPQQRSASERIADRRHIYTNEVSSDLHYAANTASRRLRSDERKTLAALLSYPLDLALAGRPPHPQPTERLRQAVIADTEVPLQQGMEAAIFLGLGRAIFHRRPGGLRQGPVCSSVHPTASNEFGLCLRPSILAPLLAELNLAGLHVTHHRRRVQLFLTDGDNEAQVTLFAIAPRQWIAAACYAHALTGAVWPTSDGAVAQQQSPSSTSEGLANTALCSALQRRVCVVGPTRWRTISLDSIDSIRLTWAGGRSADEVRLYLAQPLGGLPSKGFSFHRESDNLLTMNVHNDNSEPATTIVLHHLPEDAPPPPRSSDTAMAWAAFDHALTRPAF